MYLKRYKAHSVHGVILASFKLYYVLQRCHSNTMVKIAVITNDYLRRQIYVHYTFIS